MENGTASPTERVTMTPTTVDGLQAPMFSKLKMFDCLARFPGRAAPKQTPLSLWKPWEIVKTRNTHSLEPTSSVRPLRPALEKPAMSDYNRANMTKLRSLIISPVDPQAPPVRLLFVCHQLRLHPTLPPSSPFSVKNNKTKKLV